MYHAVRFGHRLWSLTVLDSSPTPATISYVILDKLLSFSVLECLTFQNEVLLYVS